MIKIYLVRHPETKRNVNNEITGWENTHYTKRGHEQFDEIVKFFRGKNYSVYSSDLSRAKRLGIAIARAMDKKAKFSKLLREQNFKETRPQDSSETEEELEKRVGKFIKNTGVKEMVIVSHEGVIIELKKILKEKIIGEQELVERVIELKLENVKKEGGLVI